MAKLDEGILIRGNWRGLNFYVMKKHRPERTYVRRKSSLTRERVLTDEKFEKTRKNASSLGIASKIGSAIYKALPLDIEGKWTFRAIAGEAASLLYKGKTEEEVTLYLWNKYILETKSTPPEPLREGWLNLHRSNPENRTLLREVFRKRWEEQGRSPYLFKRLWEKRSVFKQPPPERLEYLGVI